MDMDNLHTMCANKTEPPNTGTTVNCLKYKEYIIPLKDFMCYKDCPYNKCCYKEVRLHKKYTYVRTYACKHLLFRRVVANGSHDIGYLVQWNGV